VAEVLLVANCQNWGRTRYVEQNKRSVN